MVGICPQSNVDRAPAPTLNGLGLEVLSGASKSKPFISAMMVYAADRDGTDRYVRDVRRGKACECVCWTCGRAVIARQGKDRAPHFAHEAGTGRRCATLQENAQRLLKRIVDKTQPIGVPTTMGLASPRRPISFSTAEVLPLGGDKWPEVRCQYLDREIVIGIRVTARHLPKARMLEIREASAAYLILDLRAHRHATDEALEEAVTEGAPRHWIQNSRLQRQAVPEIKDADAYLAGLQLSKFVPKGEAINHPAEFVPVRPKSRRPFSYYLPADELP